MNNDLHLTHFFYAVWDDQLGVNLSALQGLRLSRIILQEFTALPWLQREMGETSRDSDTSSVDAEMNDPPHCDAQKEQAKGITTITSRVPPSVNLNPDLIFLQMHGVFTTFGDSGVQNGAILEHP